MQHGRHMLTILLVQATCCEDIRRALRLSFLESTGRHPASKQCIYLPWRSLSGPNFKHVLLKLYLSDEFMVAITTNLLVE